MSLIMVLIRRIALTQSGAKKLLLITHSCPLVRGQRLKLFYSLRVTMDTRHGSVSQGLKRLLPVIGKAYRAKSVGLSFTQSRPHAWTPIANAGKTRFAQWTAHRPGLMFSGIVT
jgi:hypothetical protein